MRMPKAPRLVIARLVRQDHAALQRRGAEFRDARRAFVHREVAADAVAGAVVVVEAGLPEELPRQRVELRAGGAVGKHRAGDGDVAVQHAGEAVAHLVGRRRRRRRCG